MPSQHNAPHTRHRGACINCRQQKARCDAYERLPTACSRCEKAGKECIIDRSFRRSARKDRLDELEKELRQLRHNISKGPATTAPSTDGEGEGDDSTTLRDSEQPFGPPAHQSQPDRTHHPRGSAGIEGSLIPSQPTAGLTVMQLEHVILQPSELLEHIAVFYRYYHDSLPILPNQSLLLPHLQSCQLLLWAIVVITSSQIESRRHLEVDLVDAIRRLVATEFLVSEAASIFQIQALLLLAFWPMPFKATIQDPSWIYSNMALSKALRIGLHRSSGFFIYMYGPQGGEKMRLRTWVACFIIAQLYAAALGLPATVRPDNIILNCVAEKPPDLPTVLHRLLVMTYKIHVFTEQLGDYRFTPDGLMPEPLPVVQAFDSDLRSLNTTTEPETIMSLMARLYLYSFILASPPAPSESTKKVPAVQSHDGVYYVSQTYNCAKQIIDLFTAQVKKYPGEETDIGEHHPRLWSCFQRWSILYATMTILWIIKLSGLESNTASAQTVVANGRNLLKRLILTKEDHYSRVCDIIDYISAMDPASSEGRNVSRNAVRARASVNLVWDVVYAAKQRHVERRVATHDTAEDYFHQAAPSSGIAPASGTADEVMEHTNGFGGFDTLFSDWDNFIPDLDLIDMDGPSPQPQW